MPELRLGLICSDYPPGPHGGIGTLTQVMARALAQRGHTVKVIGVYPPDYPARDIEDDQGVQVVRLRESDRPGGWFAARATLRRLARRWAEQGDVDLWELPDWGGWAAGWPTLPVPVLVRLHGSAVYFGAEAGRPARRLTRWLERASMRRADFVSSSSEYTAGRTRELFGLAQMPEPIIYNPIELFTPPAFAARYRRRVAFTGTLVEKKGVISLVRAWPLVLRQLPDAELHLYGKDGRTTDGRSMRAHLEALLPAEAKPTVTFHGHIARPKILEALQTARAAVFPSYAEAFALAPLESMACGCPTIYSRRGSGTELMEHGRQGLLIDPDEPDAIAEAIVRVLRDDAWAAGLSEAGRRHVAEHFGVEPLAERNERYYRSCMETFHRRRRHA